MRWRGGCLGFNAARGEGGNKHPRGLQLLDVGDELLGREVQPDCLSSSITRLVRVLQEVRFPTRPLILLLARDELEQRMGSLQDLLESATEHGEREVGYVPGLCPIGRASWRGRL